MTWRKQLKRLGKNARLRGRATPLGRTILSAAAIAMEPVDYYQRRRAAIRYNRQFPSNRMSAEEGYALLPAGTLPGTPEIIDTCRRVFTEKKAMLKATAPTGEKAIRQQRSKRSFLRNLLDNDDLRANPDLVDFALSDPLFSIVTNYLGTIPNLHSVDLLYSVARLMPDEHISSQLFHRDPEGLTQAKVFLNVFDVDEAHGPFTFIPANQSERIVAAIWQQPRRADGRNLGSYRDEEVKAHGGLDATIQLTGPAGTAAIVETSRCVHAGSRLQPGHFRHCFFLQYCTSHKNARSFQAQRFRNDPVRWLALKRRAAAD